MTNSASRATIPFQITPKGPFSLDQAAGVISRFPPLSHQPPSVIVTKTGQRIVRMGFILDGDLRSVAVSLRKDARSGRIVGEAAGTTPARIDTVTRQVARILGLDHDATTYPDIAKRDPKIGPLMKMFDGLRPVSFTSPYECACWAVISQRISKTQAARVVSELVRAHGEKVRLPSPSPRARKDGAFEEIGVFPTPDRLLDVTIVPGINKVKVARLHAIAEAALDGQLDAEAIRARGDIEGPKSLLTLPGIGPFWASGIYLRATGIADTFAADEPLSISALGNLHGLGDTPSSAAITKLTAQYKPFRMWICFLLRVAAGQGVIKATRPSRPSRPSQPSRSKRAA